MHQASDTIKQSTITGLGKQNCRYFQLNEIAGITERENDIDF